MNWKLIEPLTPPILEVPTSCDHGRGGLHRERGGTLPGAIDPLVTGVPSPKWPRSCQVVEF